MQINKKYMDFKVHKFSNKTNIIYKSKRKLEFALNTFVFFIVIVKLYFKVELLYL